MPIGSHGRPDINPYERDIDMTVPLMYRDRPLGDVPVRLTFDDQFFVETAGFLRLINPLLSDQARVNLASKLAGRPTFTSEDLESTGISLEYDPASLSIVVLHIDPEQRAVEHLFARPTPENETPDLLPAHFAGYLNLNLIESYFWNGGNNNPPSLAMNGALRLGSVVFEGEGEFGERGDLNGDTSYTFERSYARLVYDQPDQYRRWLLGDLTPEIRGQQSFVQIGGIGVIRQRRRFNEFRSAVLQGDRQLILQQDSTVRILRNGVLFRELRLNAGAYDLSALPLLNGSNNFQIQVTDNSGRIQDISYQSYLDPIDLEPGDYEYAAYIGPTNVQFGQSPTYGGPISFSGFFRKAFINRPALGIGVQANRDVQNVTGQVQFVVGNGARILLDGGASHARNGGAGGSAGVAYDQIIERAGLTDYFSIRADYLSKRYAGLGSLDPLNTTALNINAQYTRSISSRLTALIDGNYSLGRSTQGDNYRLGAAANYYISRQWSVRAGIDYTHFPRSFSNNGGLGFTVSLVYQPNYRSRAEARYDSSIDSALVSFTRASSNEIGSIGYGAAVGRDDGSINAQAFADYTANRFDASLSQGTFAQNLSSFGQANVTTVRIGTSIAFADGVFGVGRRINDSFAILFPHSNLGRRHVVAGQSLAENQYVSRSGTFGGAVNNYLTSYITQSVQYDVEDPPTGYDVGPGVYRVRPSYRSGYAIRIGTDAFVSTIGTLLMANGQPVSLAGGRVVPISPDSGSPLPFFTNSVGRFAVANLRPGTRYRVELYSASGSSPAFEFEVPRDTSGLVDLHTISLPPAR